MSKRNFGSQHLKFLMVAILMLIILDRFVFGSTRPYIEEARQQAAIEAVREYEEQKPMELARLTPAIKIPEHKLFREQFGPPVPPPWQKYAVPSGAAPGLAKVVIVIDDLGVSRGYSREIIDLTGPLTLAFLPYAEGVGELVEAGKRGGHEIMVHMPMEPMNGALDTGDIFLSTGQNPEEFGAMLDKGLSVFSGYVGINNHMGSRLTQDEAAMERVMEALKSRGLLFLDSKTISSSVAGKTAAQFGVPYAVRDVFLDHDPSLEGVRKSLEQTEEIALEHGQAIAIGHPKPHTITALKEWLPTLEAKGIVLVPVSAAVVTTKPSVASAVPSLSPIRPHQ